MVYCLGEDSEVWGWMRGLHVFWPQAAQSLLCTSQWDLMTATSLRQLVMKADVFILSWLMQQP